MFAVTGANLFTQWFLCDNIFYKFTTIPQTPSLKLDSDRAKIVCISWSFVILQIDDKFVISGAWDGKEGQITTLPLPNESIKSSSLLVSCNDYNIVMVDAYNNAIWVLDLKTENFRRVHIVESLVLDISDNVQSRNNIIKVKATNSTCLFLTSDGIVFVGILPCYLDTKHCVGKVIDVQCGYEHFLLLTDIGRVYTWGNGRRLQLGHGDINNLETPTEVEGLAGIKITKISANGWHSLALSESGDLYAWGWNDTGQLGIRIDKGNEAKENVNNFGLPNLINIYDENDEEVELNVKDIACGTRHSAILLEDNSIWTSGCNKYGQLGFPSDQYGKVEAFKKCFRAPQDATLLCGPWCTVIDY